LKETFISAWMPHCLFGNQLAPQFFGGGSTPTSTAQSRHME